jgi:hypothetical protein
LGLGDRDQGLELPEGDAHIDLVALAALIRISYHLIS